MSDSTRVSASMLTRIRQLAPIVILSLARLSVASETLLFEDFQDGDSEGWRVYGARPLAISTYDGNASLRMTATAMAVRQVSSEGFVRVRIGASVAASGLERDDACIGEATVDDGESWTEIIRVVDGQDDAITLHSAAVSIDLPNNTARVWFRGRINGNDANDTCWFDNIFIVGQRASGKAIDLPPTRTLSLTMLTGHKDLSDPVVMTEFAVPGAAEKPRHTFSGSLRLIATDSSGSFGVVQDDWDRQGAVGEPIGHLPEFDFQFVQRGNDIVPLASGVRRRQHPYWEIILQAGKTWNEVDDGDWTRAAVPFSLQERSANCTHNGVMTWLFNDQQVSRVAYQISSETCGYLKFDMWGIVAAEYERLELAEQAAASFARLDSHRLSRLPVKPIVALADDYPGVEPLSFGADDGIRAETMTVYGLVVDGINYRSDCNTRRGPYPFCASLPLPSFSTAKSIFAGIAMMRLEKLIPGLSQTTISSQIDECNSRKWRAVTIENALDMATGNFHSKLSGEDEDSAAHRQFIFDDKHRSKLEFACENFRRKAKPGKQFVYHTSDTYLVGDALQKAVAKRDSADTDLYRTILAEGIWRRLNLSALLDDAKRTYDSSAQPFTGYGLTYEVDDVIRIAAWLSNENAVLDGVQVLDARMLNASLQRTPSDRGLNAGANDLKYNNGFWAFDAGPTLDCEHPVWTPFMSGVSGITVAMFPNGIIYYYFSDSYIFRWQSGRNAAHAIRDLCG